MVCNRHGNGNLIVVLLAELAAILTRYKKINDSGLWRRIACLEYFALLGSRLSVP